MHVYLFMYICLPVIGKTSFIVFTITFSTEEVITERRINLIKLFNVNEDSTRVSS